MTTPLSTGGSPVSYLQLSDVGSHVMLHSACGPSCLELSRKKKIRSDITPDPSGHRPQRPCTQRRTRAKQDQAQASAPGQTRTRSVGGATTHGRRTRQAKACQHRRGRGLAGAHCRRRTQQERCNKIQTLKLHVPRGHTAQGSCRVEQERDNTSRGR